MVDLFWLLLPVAACSGWLAANKDNVRHKYFKKSGELVSFKFNQNYIKGLNFVLNDETDKAVDVFLDLFSVDNDTVETHMALGSLFRRRGEVERALRIHQNVIARPNLCPEQRLSGMLELGYDYLCAGVLDRAENIFKDIVKQYPNNATAMQHLIDIYQRQKEWHSAIEVALALKRNTSLGYIKNIAHYYCELAEQKKFQVSPNDAFFYIKQALKLHDASVRANLLLAEFYLNNSQYKKGLKIYYNLASNNKDYLDIILPKLVNSVVRFDNSSGDYLTRFINQLAQTSPQVFTINAVIDYLIQVNGYDYVWHMVSSATKNTPKLGGLKILLSLIGERGFINNSSYETLQQSIDKILSDAKNYICNKCGFTCSELLWLCPSCKSWDSVHHIDFSD